MSKNIVPTSRSLFHKYSPITIWTFCMRFLPNNANTRFHPTDGMVRQDSQRVHYFTHFRFLTTGGRLWQVEIAD